MEMMVGVVNNDDRNENEFGNVTILKRCEFGNEEITARYERR